MSVNLYGWFSSQGACPLKLIPCEQQPGTILKKDSRDLVEFIVSEGYGVVKYSSGHPKPIKLKVYSPKPKLYLCQALKSSKIRLEQNDAVKLESQKNGRANPSLNNKNTKTGGGGTFRAWPRGPVQLCHKPRHQLILPVSGPTFQRPTILVGVGHFYHPAITVSPIQRNP